MVAIDNFYSRAELQQLGLKHFGINVKVSRSAIFYGNENISIGDNSRIDDLCLLSASNVGEIVIGKHVHISAGVFLFGRSGISIGDFVGISAGCKLYSETDDYSGNYLTNPTIDTKYRNVICQQVILEKHSIVGAGSILLPGAILLEGSAVGAMSLVNKELEAWGMYVGSPLRKLKNRSKGLLALENNFMIRASE
jgi:galactoside O-acetyltransferase